MASASDVPRSENMENIKNIILRQTDYTEEEIIQKLKEHNNDPLAIIREYMVTPSSAPATEAQAQAQATAAPAKSVNQQIYGEIRSLMDTAAKTYQLKKEYEERMTLYREQAIRARNNAAAAANNNIRNNLSNNNNNNNNILETIVE
jgi:hypothetical protein